MPHKKEEIKKFKVGKLKLPEAEKSNHKIHKDLPQPPFRWAITGTSGSGKGGMLVYVLNKGYRKYFKRRYFFSSTFANNRVFKALKVQKNDTLFSSVTEDILKNIIDMQKQIGPSKHPVLCVFDDLTKREYKNLSFLNDSIRFIRHSNISFVFCVQKYNIMSTEIRENISHLSIFSINSNREFKTIAMDIPYLEPKELEQVYKNKEKIVREELKKNKDRPRSFLHMDKQKSNLKINF